MNAKISTKDKIKSKIHSQDSVPSFIRKTYDILEERKFPEVIDWNPEGTALVIKKPSDFCQKVLPAYFKHNNLTSFVRQLNMYNFHKRRTQNIDHVYYHELFQKGKKHLLKEIKRKNHEHAADKSQKITETLETSQNGKDFSSLVYENQFLKRLYNDAMSKVTMLEGQVKELTLQNQSLWNQVCQQNNGDRESLKPMLARFDSKTELTQDQLPMTFGEVVIPPLKMSAERQMALQNMPFVKGQANVNSYLNLGTEESGDSTEASHNSPSLQPSMESDKCFDMSESTPHYIEAAGQTFHLPQITLTPQVSQFQGNLFPSRQEFSMGQVFDSWNYENQNNDMICFADQKENKAPINTPEGGILGKRPLELDNQAFQVPEPLMKRHELSLFSRRGMISNGTEELMRTFFRRESSVNDEYDTNMGVDLMDFNQPFLGWTKAA